MFDPAQADWSNPDTFNAFSQFLNQCSDEINKADINCVENGLYDATRLVRLQEYINALSLNIIITSKFIEARSNRTYTLNEGHKK